MAAPVNMWECPKCGDYVDNCYKTCPHCNSAKENASKASMFSPSAPSNSEHKSEEIWIVRPTHASVESWASKFLKVIAVIIFIGGLVVACMTANVEVIGGGYSSCNKFDWLIFFETYLIYGLGGCFTLCASELFENIKRIADSLSCMEIRKKK